MTVSTLAPSASSQPTLTASAVSHHPLLPVLDAATHASREAHEAARALTDTVLACQQLPAEVYQYAPHLSYATGGLTAASRALTTATGYATTNPTADNLRALHRATAELVAATAALRYQTAALASAAGWYSTPIALTPTASAPPAEQGP